MVRGTGRAALPDQATQPRPILGQVDDRPVLLRNARIFTGSDETLLEGHDVLVAEGLIAKIAKDIDADKDWQLIDAEGRVMSPGFIDAHAHVMFQISFPEAFGSDEFYWAYKATAAAETYLMKGFTAIRDVGGNTFSLKKNIDAAVRGHRPGNRQTDPASPRPALAIHLQSDTPQALHSSDQAQRDPTKRTQDISPHVRHATKLAGHGPAAVGGPTHRSPGRSAHRSLTRAFAKRVGGGT